MRIATGAKAVLKTLGGNVNEILFVLGSASVIVGVWQIHEASAWIVGGVGLVYLALLGARKAG